MTFELINFNGFNDSVIFNNNINWDYELANEWGDVAVKAQKLFEKQTEKKIEPSDDNSSLFAEEGSQNGEVKEVREFLTKETESSMGMSQNGDDTKVKKRINTRVKLEELEEYVKNEICNEGIESVLNF